MQFYIMRATLLEEINKFIGLLFKKLVFISLTILIVTIVLLNIFNYFI
jgi:hypothetical protein